VQIALNGKNLMKRREYSLIRRRGNGRCRRCGQHACRDSPR